MESPTNGQAGNGSERTQFRAGNSAAVGRANPSVKALTRQFLRRYLTETLAEQILDAQAVKALDGDNAAAKFLMDYTGWKPVEETRELPTFLSPEEAEEVKRCGCRLSTE